MCKNRQHGHTGRGVGVLTAPCDQDTTPYGSKPLLWKRIVYQTIVGGKNEKKTNISPFPATHTYIKLTFVSFFFNFFFLNLSLIKFLISLKSIKPLLGEIRKKKTNISPFPATHTYIKLTLVSFFPFFFAPFPYWDTCALYRQHWSFPLWRPVLKPLLWIAHWQKWPRWFIAGRWQLITPSDELMVTWVTFLWCPVKGNHATHQPLHEND